LEQKINAGSKIEGVIHCFNGTWPQAKKYLDLGFFIGVNGIIFKMRLDEALKNIPLGRIVLETDCPFLVPPGAASQRNEPAFLPDIAKRLADIKGLSLKTVAETTTKNAKKLFHIKV
jgi:TatD DNase family protein